MTWPGTTVSWSRRLQRGRKKDRKVEGEVL